MKNLDKLIYTYKNKKIVYLLRKKYSNNKELLEQLNNHDLDKMFLLLFYDKDIVKKIHRETSSHHDNNLDKTKLDYMEMVLDWESARYTKPDKPLNAYDTLYKYYPHLEENIIPILKDFGIDYSSTNMEDDVVDYVNTLESIDENDIKKELVYCINKIN